MKNNNFLRFLFTEPNTKKYALTEKMNDVVGEDLSWYSHHRDSKNLSSDYKSVRNDLKKSLSGYSSKVNG